MGTQKRHRAQDHLAGAAHAYPQAWEQADTFRAGRGIDLPDWPEDVYLPLAGWYAIVSGGGNNRVSLQVAGDVGRLAALGTWRQTQGIYRFDPAVFDAVASTPVNGNLPCEVLHHLPEWCVYVETPGLHLGAGPLYGFFAHWEWDANTGREELRLLLDGEESLTAIPLHMGSWSLSECIRRALEVASIQALGAGPGPLPVEMSNAIKPMLEPMVSLLLYLCSEAGEVSGKSGAPGNPVPTKTKRGLRTFPAATVRPWDVGLRLGNALRAAYHAAETVPAADSSETEGDALRHRPRGHVRRAHWHTFRHGPGRLQVKAKWLPSIPVNLDSVGDMPAVVRKVQ